MLNEKLQMHLKRIQSVLEVETRTREHYKIRQQTFYTSRIWYWIKTDVVTLLTDLLTGQLFLKKLLFLKCVSSTLIGKCHVFYNYGVFICNIRTVSKQTKANTCCNLYCLPCGYLKHCQVTGFSFWRGIVKSSKCN